MDDNEQSADQYLRSCGFTNPVYEPDGRVPPDFRVDGEIAVEVRRLNQMHKAGAEMRGLEQVQKSFTVKLPSLLKDLGPSAAQPSWFVSLSFRRPLRPWRQIRRRLVEELRAFSQDARRRTGSQCTINVEKPSPLTCTEPTVRIPTSSSTADFLISMLAGGSFPSLNETCHMRTTKTKNAVS